MSGKLSVFVLATFIPYAIAATAYKAVHGPRYKPALGTAPKPTSIVRNSQVPLWNSILAYLYENDDDSALTNSSQIIQVGNSLETE